MALECTGVPLGWNFKSDLVRYYTRNSVGKMSQYVYINQILEPVIKPWLEGGDGHDFTLLEDNDSGHRGSKSIAWKEEQGLKYFFNPPHSPDINIIENCWRNPQHKVRTFVQFADDADDLFTYAKMGWDELQQETINSYVLSLPQRLRDIVANGGAMVGRERLRRAQLEAELELPDSQETEDDL